MLHKHLAPCRSDSELHVIVSLFQCHDVEAVVLNDQTTDENRKYSSQTSE